MKKLVFLLFLLINLSVYSQDYPVFPDSMATWTNVYSEIGGTFPIFGITYMVNHKYSLTNQDTLIAGNQYAQLFYQGGMYTGGIRQEEKQVYFALHGDTLEYLLYDFGAEAGDTIFDVFIADDFSILPDEINFNLRDCVVLDLDSVLCHDNVMRKHYWLYNSYAGEFEWIEGIGSVSGLFWGSGANVSFYQIDLGSLCVNDAMQFLSEGIGHLLQDPEDPCNGGFALELDELTTPSLKLSPNPAADFLYIELNDFLSKTELSLLNSQGQVIRSISMNPNERYRLDVSGLAKGIYILQFDYDGLRHAEKLIIE